jgi:hypothetical protein
MLIDALIPLHLQELIQIFANVVNINWFSSPPVFQEMHYSFISPPIIISFQNDIISWVPDA